MKRVTSQDDPEMNFLTNALSHFPLVTRYLLPKDRTKLFAAQKEWNQSVSMGTLLHYDTCVRKLLSWDFDSTNISNSIINTWFSHLHPFVSFIFGIGAEPVGFISWLWDPNYVSLSFFIHTQGIITNKGKELTTINQFIFKWKFLLPGDRTQYHITYFLLRINIYQYSTNSQTKKVSLYTQLMKRSKLVWLSFHSWKGVILYLV